MNIVLIAQETQLAIIDGKGVCARKSIPKIGLSVPKSEFT
ncbi:hypothetical protein SAMN02745220_05235 [Desulfopila aestuarii DSM 18488]|uniref:Uncharacterized protein n=1 Tax=Desulfopila aestuarii DSM 18488 TaxID=1121416 RepID=A0A1M7YLY3_9BACT|nr:hypothetical protein SAMN02745220_05235 [Desulfopila aestuarii DSM 18488]